MTRGKGALSIENIGQFVQSILASFGAKDVSRYISGHAESDDNEGLPVVIVPIGSIGSRARYLAGSVFPQTHVHQDSGDLESPYEVIVGAFQRLDLVRLGGMRIGCRGCHTGGLI